MRQPDLSARVAVDIEAWLRRLGVEEYAPAFRDNHIDAEVLPELTAEDLNALGVHSVGHRRKLLAAIAAVRHEPTPTGERAAEETTNQPQEAHTSAGTLPDDLARHRLSITERDRGFESCFLQGGVQCELPRTNFHQA